MNTIEKLRSVHIPLTGGMVAFDWGLTILGAYLLTNTISDSYQQKLGLSNFISFIIVLVLLLILSIFLHIAFSVPTITNYYLGLSKKPFRTKLI